MTNTEKTRILKEMRKRIEVGRYAGMCAVLEEINREEGLGLTLSELGITRRSWGNGEYWFPKYEKEPRLKLIDEALAKREPDPIQQAEQRVKEAQAELERLRNTPKDAKDMYKKQEMYFLYGNGDIEDVDCYRKDAFLSKARAEKELLRIRLAFIADSLNGGLFEQEQGRGVYFIYWDIGLCKAVVAENSCSVYYGFIYFKTRELAEEAMTYFTKEELIKMLK